MKLVIRIDLFLSSPDSWFQGHQDLFYRIIAGKNQVRAGDHRIGTVDPCRILIAGIIVGDRLRFDGASPYSTA